MEKAFNPFTGEFDFVRREKTTTIPIFDIDESGSRTTPVLLHSADFKALCTEDAEVVFKPFTFPNIITSVRETVFVFGLKVDHFHYYLPRNPEGTILEDHIYVENGSYKVKANVFKCSANGHYYKYYNDSVGRLSDLTARTENILPFSKIVAGSFESFSNSMADGPIDQIIFAPTYNRFLAVTGSGYYTQWSDGVYLSYEDYKHKIVGRLYRNDSGDLYYRNSDGLALIGNLPIRCLSYSDAGENVYTILPDCQYHIDHKYSTYVKLYFMTSVPIQTFSGKLRFSVFIDGRKTAPSALSFACSSPILWHGGDVPVINTGEVLWIEGEYHSPDYGYKEDADVNIYEVLTLSYKKFRQ